MDQGKLFWPNLWLKESWARFDFGILPGKKWANRWKQSSWYNKSRPKVGVILTGWPKSENLKKFKIKKKTQRIQFYMPHVLKLMIKANK